MGRNSSYRIDRRAFLVRVAAAAAAAAVPGSVLAQGQVPIIDTHIHLFDPRRPQGAPYRGPANSAFQIEGAAPDQYRRLLAPHGVVGAIKVEASPWIEDNLWVLEVCAEHDIMVGVVGNLRPDVPEFPEYLDRFSKHDLFRGIRYGNLWGYDIVEQSRNPVFLENLKLLAEADLVLDSANPRVDMLEALIRINDVVPDLRIVIDHLPKLEPTPETQASYDAVLSELAVRPNIYCKISAVIHPVDGQISTQLESHRPRLDLLMNTFGVDRVIFGTDWPNNESDTSVNNVVRIMREYFSTRPREDGEKYFWRNSATVYKWIARTGVQRQLL